MQAELPTMLNVLDTDYQLEYSESYTVAVHQKTAIEGYQYCTCLQRAFGSLLSQNYTNFILTTLTVRCIVFFYLLYCWNGIQNIWLMQGMYRIDQRPSSRNRSASWSIIIAKRLVCYFQSLRNDDISEVKGVHINEV